KSTPIQSKVVAITSSFQEVALNWICDNTDGTYKGEYYFGYISNSLAVQPIARDYECANIRSNIAYTWIESMFVPDVINTNLWDLTKRQ
ncbi:hypothetical protein ACI3PL_23710, partial [Lacticaseibacillus paracasei]